MNNLYDLPNGWEWKKLGELCNFIRGPFGGSLKKQIFKESGNAVYEQSHAIYNQFEQIRYFIDDEKFEEMKRFELRPNSLIMSCSGTIGKVAIVPNNIKKGIINQALLMLTPNHKLNNVFLKLMMESNFFQTLLSENSTGAAIANIASVKVLKELKIPLPPLPEQQRIVSKLDNLFEKIDKAIALHQKNMDEADAFMGSVLNDVFGELEEKYEVKLLGSLTKTTSGGTPKRNEKSYWGGNIGWLKSGELNDGYITKVEEFITEDGLNKSSAKLFPIGTLLIAMYGATVGRLGILEIETTTNQAVCGILNDKNQFETLYMFYYLKKIREKMLKDSFGGAQPNISQTYIKELEVPLPPLHIQQKVVKYLDEISQKIEKVKQVQKEKMDNLKALKASILDSPFGGGLL
ncbi:MAG: restriction endonuclease subunit S [Campylobacterales bacterium]